MTINDNSKILLLSLTIVACLGFFFWFIFYLRSNYPGTQMIKTVAFLRRKKRNLDFTDNLIAAAREKTPKSKLDLIYKIDTAYQRLGTLDNYQTHMEKVKVMRIFIIIIAVIVYMMFSKTMGASKIGKILLYGIVGLFLVAALVWDKIAAKTLFSAIDSLNKGIVFELYDVCSQFAALGKEGHTLDSILLSIQKSCYFLKQDLDLYRADLYRMSPLDALTALSDRVTLFGPCTEMTELCQIIYSMYTQDADQSVTEIEFVKLRDKIFAQKHEARMAANQKSIKKEFILSTLSLMLGCSMFLVAFVAKIAPSLSGIKGFFM